MENYSCRARLYIVEEDYRARFDKLKEKAHPVKLQITIIRYFLIITNSN